MSQEFKEPTTQDIIDLLKEQETMGAGFKSTEELDAAVNLLTKPFDIEQLSDEERRMLEGGAVPDEESDEKVDTPKPEEFDLPSTSDDLDFTMDFHELGRVEVEELERDLYLKTLLNDTSFTLDIEVIRGFNVTVKSRTVFYDDLIYDMVRMYSEKGEVLGLESGFTKLMRLLAGVQVVAIQGRNVEFQPTRGATRKELSKELTDHVAAVYNDFNLTKWNAVVKAVRIFDSKQKICNDKVLDRTFWEGANTN